MYFYFEKLRYLPFGFSSLRIVGESRIWIFYFERFENIPIGIRYFEKFEKPQKGFSTLGNFEKKLWISLGPQQTRNI